jgi:hypothetical protein
MLTCVKVQFGARSWPSRTRGRRPNQTSLAYYGRCTLALCRRGMTLRVRRRRRQFVDTIRAEASARVDVLADLMLIAADRLFGQPACASLFAPRILYARL